MKRMTRYFFDLTEGNERTADDTGRLLAGDEEAMREASSMMTAVASDVAKQNTRGQVSVSVRRADGEVAYKGSLLFSVKGVD